MVDSAIEIFVSVYLRKLSKIFARNENKFVQHARKYVPGVRSLLACMGRFGLLDAGRLCGVQR